MRSNTLTRVSNNPGAVHCLQQQARFARRFLEQRQYVELPRGESQRLASGQPGQLGFVSLRQGSIITLCPFALLPFGGSRGLAPWLV